MNLALRRHMDDATEETMAEAADLHAVPDDGSPGDGREADRRDGGGDEAAPRKPRVRDATEADRGLFRKLWRAYLTEEHGQGSPVVPSEANLDFFLTVFDAYVEGVAAGVVLFIGHEAVLLWGYGGPAPLETDFGEQAQGWGTYVKESARGKGYSRVLREEAVSRLREMGFDVVLGSGLVGNEMGVGSGQSFGFKPVSTVHVLRLSG